MSLMSSILRTLSTLLHEESKPIYVNVSYLQPNLQLEGKKIIITGGGRGLGASMAEKFVKEGADVLIAGRSEKSVKDTAEKLGCKYLSLDVQDVAGFKAFLDKADKMLNGANCLVNNAGISLHEEGFLAVNPNQFDSQFDTNLKGPFFLTQCFISMCIENNIEGTKNILFTSSETSITVDERPYGLTKAALNSLIQGIACRFVKQGFRINAIAPGITASEMTGINPNGNLALGINATGRAYLPEEVAEVASFLLSDASNCLNGQILFCNEGRTINTRW